MSKYTLTKVLIKMIIDKIKFILACVVTKQDYFVLFQSFDGESYSDNPRFISEKLHELYPNVTIVWAFKNPETKKGVVPEYVKIVKLDESFNYYRILASCKVWVSNFSFKYIPKRKGQYFIQTWHGDRGFKKVLNDSGRRTRLNKVSEGIPQYCNLAIAGSEYGVKQYRSAFGYTGEIIVKGTPRDDFLVNPNDRLIHEIKSKLGLDSSTRIILFAPTFRQTNLIEKTAQNFSSINIPRLLDQLEDNTTEKWIGLLRAHPAISGLLSSKKDERVIDVSRYEDMADLLLISNILITDYSSSAGDFALLNRPVVLFQSDINSYIKTEREFYFEQSESPFYTVFNQDELENMILSLDDNNVKQNCEKILSFYGTNETGESSRIVAERIYDFIGK